MIKERNGDLALRVCDECGHEQWVTYWNLVKKPNHLCRSCNNKLEGVKRQGKRPWNKGKKQEPKNLGSFYLDSSGYIQMWVGKHTVSNRAGGYYLEHRLMSELKLNRELQDNELVHHIDADKTNNIESNLYVCEDDHHHRKVHGQLERLSMELVRDGLIKFDHVNGQYYLDPQWGNPLSKSCELLGSPEVDNQQRSLHELPMEERSTTIQKWSTLKRVEAQGTITDKADGDDIVSSL